MNRRSDDGSSIDPVTYEVLRHRLWMINDEQAEVAIQVSGSPVVYETKDLSSALMTANGDALFVSAHASRLALCIQYVTKSVIERCAENPGIHPGDAFITNDPWAGAMHQNDMAMVAPVFWEDRLVAWTGLVMHEVDVGGATAGGLSVGSSDVFAEGPLVPPIKIVEAGVLRTDLESWAVRNSRTPVLNSLDIRGRIAACGRTARRLTEVIGRYGCDTLIEVQDAIIERTRAAIAARIARLADGEWVTEGVLDHDGVTDRRYRIRLTLRKRGERLEFDFTGTDAQAAGGINCTRVGLESGVIGSVLPTICYDLPWSTGALRPLLDITSEPGTINNATHPAGVSHGTVAASRATAHVALSALSKMCAVSSSGLSSQSEANWTAGWQGMTLDGYDEHGTRFTGVTLDQPGGGGARVASDGLDNGGTPGAPSFGISNVETYEAIYPLLYLHRRQAIDSGGPGYHRGGVGTEVLVMAHKAHDSFDVNVVAHGASQPEASGLYGGYPGCVQVRVLFHGSGLRERFIAGETVTDPLAEARAGTATRLEAKQRLRVDNGDALLFVRSGGGGMGDPLERPADHVARDIDAGLCSVEVGEQIYGVVLDEAREVDVDATRRRREGIRRRRMSGVRVDDRIDLGPASPEDSPIGEIVTAYTLAGRSGEIVTGCLGCGRVLGVGSDPKRGSVVTERSIVDASPWNRFGDVDGVVVREFSCPSCGRLGGVEVRCRTDPVLFDVAFSARQASGTAARAVPG